MFGTPPLNFFSHVQTDASDFFKEALKCPLMKQVLLLAERVVGILFFYLILVFYLKKQNFWPIFSKKLDYITEEKLF